jgi:hypothetical protein
MVPFLFVIERNESFFKPKWITFQENFFKNTIHFNKNNIDIFINDIWQKYEGDYSKLQGDLNFFTNEKAMLTFTRRFLPPNHPVA